MKKQPDEILLDYASSYLSVTCRPNEAIAVTLEKVVGFAKLLRQGCEQDLKRLIVKCIEDTPSGVDGKTALLAFGQGIETGGAIELWGLPDCACDRVDCVYCGPRIGNSARSASGG